MIIVPFRDPDDRAPVIALWQACGLTRPWNDPDKDIDRKLAVDAEGFLVGKDDAGQLIACAMMGYDGHRGSVNYLAVHPDHQNQGLGKQMMRHIEETLIHRGCPKINLLVRSDNTSVIDVYQRLGYSVDACVPLGHRLIPD